jgi:hypothetical protein
MNYLERWNLLVGRIRGHETACRLFLGFSGPLIDNAPGVLILLADQCKATVDEIRKYGSEFGIQLPAAATEGIGRFLEGQPKSDVKGVQLLQSLVVQLVAFEGELSYLLQNRQQLIRRLSERAFIHLQRSIAADPEIQAKWQAAFKRETDLERLGSVHLLLHGIWAFKADAGARTDLIFGEQIETYAEELRAASGLVLTEWKKAKSPVEVDSRFAEARRQAQSYSQGPLAGIELTTYRYLVVVTEKQIRNSWDEVVDGITYRHINIAVDPDMPSVVARNRAQ